MLIVVDRHTDEDLELWDALEKADFSHAVPGWKVIEARRAIQSFAADGPCWCGVSCGKDSVVLASLVAAVAPDVPLVWIRPRRATPYGDIVRQILEPILGQSILVLDEPEGANWENWGDGIPIANHRFGPRAIHGVRAEESSIRQLSAGKHGVITQRFCRPLLHWSARDIFAWLAQHHLPVHPNYAMLGGGRWNRERIRVGSIGGPRGRGIGRAEWEQEYYGDVLRRIEAGCYSPSG